MDFEEWNIKYNNFKVANLRDYLKEEYIVILKKLGIEVKEEKYTGADIERVYQKYIIYCVSEEMSEEEKRKIKEELEEKNVSEEEYKELLEVLEVVVKEFCWQPLIIK